MGLLGVTIDEQKEVIRIIVSEEQADRVFEAMYLAGGLDTPGKGIMFMTNWTGLLPIYLKVSSQRDCLREQDDR